MKTHSLPIIVRFGALVLCAAGLALSGPIYLQAAEQATKPTTATYGSGKSCKTTIERQSEGELSAEDLHQASLLSSQLLMHLNAAARHCVDGKAEEARPEIQKAQSLAGIVRKLLPVTTVTTLVKDADGKELYCDVQKIQEDQIPIFSGDIAVEVVEPLVEAKKDQTALKGLKLADADVIHTSVLADLGYIERKLARALQLLNKPEDAAAQLILAQDGGVKFSAHREDSPLVEVQHALRLAERMARESKFEGAKANLELARLGLETYRGLVQSADTKPIADLQKEIEKVSRELEKPGATEQIRAMWDKARGWFKSEGGQARESAPAPTKDDKS
jgi:YfdX protein